MSAVLRKPRQRTEPLPHDALAGTFDVAVIGAGINGCGIARDCAMRGLRVLLVDKGDIGGETTAWSTRLIHGGLRYLEHVELALVRESLRERQTLLKIAPHLVEPLRFMVPVYEGHKRGRLTIRVGMIAYDLLSTGKRLPRHRMMSSTEMLKLEPGLCADGLRGGAQYWDSQVTFPERLALENAMSAASQGATVITYLRLTGVAPNDHESVRLTLRDELELVAAETSARAVVNATGPWVDDIAALTGAKRLIGGTRGSHIVVAAFPGAPACAVYAEAKDDQRPFFVIPWNGLYLIGTTDTRHDESADAARPTRVEIRYLLEQTRALFPESDLDEHAILFAYAGVRPLPYSPGGSESAITRRHAIVRHEAPFNTMISVVGGKLTTYRELAEQVTTDVFKILKARDPGSTTANERLPGAQAVKRQREDIDDSGGMSDAVLKRLSQVYGTRRAAVFRAAREYGDATTITGTSVLRHEVQFAMQQEMAQTIEDVVMRRTMLGLSGPLGPDTTESMLSIASSSAGWSEERKDIERQSLADYLSRFYPSVETERAGAE